LATEGRITASVLLVNAPDAERAVGAWQRAAPDADLGWHPNLTLDRPVCPPESVTSLVQPDGQFWPLGQFLKRVLLGQIAYADVVREWTAQLRRFVELVGGAPPVVNSHQHVALFTPCATALLDVLRAHHMRPYLRRVVEGGSTLRHVPGGRVKRTILTMCGRHAARRASRASLPGCTWLIGVTDHPYVADERFWERWLQHLPPTGTVEVCCHPGYEDTTLIGRDCDAGVGLQRRPRETALLRLPSFQTALDAAGLTIIRPSTFLTNTTVGRGPMLGALR
jgi:predicted glycoside hydrolase/deacetylase ChbG (UPF0249 family)